MYKIKKEHILVLRTSDENRKSHGGFQYPEKGYVEAPDWDGGKKVCGGKLHGLPEGKGDGSLLNWNTNAVWQIIDVDKKKGYVEFSEKCGFRCGVVVHTGNQQTATQFLLDSGITGKIVGVTINDLSAKILEGGDDARVTGGDGATVTGGDGAIVTGGYGARVTGGDGAEFIVKYYDGKRDRTSVGYVGENGIKIGKTYKVNKNGKFVLVNEQI